MGVALGFSLPERLERGKADFVTYIKAPPTEPICTIAETFALMFAWSTLEYEP